MSFDSVIQRVQELRAMIDPASVRGPVSPAARPSSQYTNAGGTNFAAMLARAQVQQSALAGDATGLDGDPALGGGGGAPSIGTLLSALPGVAGSSPASGLPTLAAPAATMVPPYLLQTLGALPELPGIGFPGAPADGSLGQRIAQIASGEIGVTESPPGSNEGERIRTYRTATRGAADTPGPWCAYFVSWLAREAGAPIGPDGSGFGWVPSIERWGKQTGRWFASGERDPQAGDIVIFDWGRDGVGDHTGVVEHVDGDGTVHTIEGNTSDRVDRRSYAPSEIRGFVRPG